MRRVASKEYTRGSILVVSLWMVALLFLMAFGLIWRGRLGVRQEVALDVEAQASELIYTLALEKLAHLGSDEQIDFDAYTETWARRTRLNTSELQGGMENTSSGSNEFSFGAVAVDEAGKINVNFASQDLLREAIREAGVLDASDEIALAILDWRDSDDRGFAESAHYAAKTPSYTAANADLQRIEELLFVEGIDATSFFGEDLNHNHALEPQEDDGDLFLPLDNADGVLQHGILDLFTVYGDGVINVNGASGVVLRAVFRSALEDREAERLSALVVGRRRGLDGLDGTEDDHAFEDEKAFIKLIGEQAWTRCLAAGIEFGVTSDAFRFYFDAVHTASGYTARGELVVLRDNGELIPLEWHTD